MRPLSRFDTFRVCPACRGNSLTVGEICPLETGDTVPFCKEACIVREGRASIQTAKEMQIVIGRASIDTAADVQQWMDQ